MARDLIPNAEFQRRIALVHSALLDTAIERINKLIREAAESPVIIPVEVFTDNAAVRSDLSARLRAAGWQVTPPDHLPADRRPEGVEGRYVQISEYIPQSDWRNAK